MSKLDDRDLLDRNSGEDESILNLLFESALSAGIYIHAREIYRNIINMVLFVVHEDAAAFAALAVIVCYCAV